MDGRGWVGGWSKNVRARTQITMEQRTTGASPPPLSLWSNSERGETQTAEEQRSQDIKKVQKRTFGRSPAVIQLPVDERA